MNELFDNDTSKYKTYMENPIEGDAIANPCGIIAKYFFNGNKIFKKLDTYSLKDNIGNRILINENNISSYGYRDINYQKSKIGNETQWINVENGI